LSSTDSLPWRTLARMVSVVVEDMVGILTFLEGVNKNQTNWCRIRRAYAALI